MEKIENLWKQRPKYANVDPGGTQGGNRRRHLHDPHAEARRLAQARNEVNFGVPAFHPLPPDADGSRLTFARWLVDKNHRQRPVRW
jgi:hypothetical protein